MAGLQVLRWPGKAPFPPGASPGLVSVHGAGLSRRVRVGCSGHGCPAPQGCSGRAERLPRLHPAPRGPAEIPEQGRLSRGRATFRDSLGDTGWKTSLGK